MLTCHACPHYQSRQDGTDKGWCGLFNHFARECHQQTQDCINEIKANEEPKVEAPKPAKQSKQPREVIRLSAYLWKVVGATSNIYLVDTFDKHTCNCKAGQHNRDCYHVAAVKQAEADDLARVAARFNISKQNGELKEQLESAASEHGVAVGRVDYVSFSAEIILGGNIVGSVGFNVMRGYYFTPKCGYPVAVSSFYTAIAKLKLFAPKARA